MSHTHPFASTRPGRPALPRPFDRGSALLLMLVAIACLSAFVSAALHTAHATSQSARLFLREMAVEEAARSGLDVAKARLASLRNKDRRQGSIDMRLGSGRVTVAFVAETGRLNSNLAVPADLATVFTDAGLSVRDTDTLVKALSERHASTGSTTGNKTGAKASTGAPSPSLSGLLALPDMTPQLFARIAPLLTPCSGTATVDAAIAPAPLVAALMGGDTARAAAFIAANRSQPPTEATPEAFPSETRPLIAMEVAPILGARLDITAEVDGLKRHYRGLLCAAGGDFSEARIVDWAASP